MDTGRTGHAGSGRPFRIEQGGGFDTLIAPDGQPLIKITDQGGNEVPLPPKILSEAQRTFELIEAYGSEKYAWMLLFTAEEKLDSVARYIRMMRFPGYDVPTQARFIELFGVGGSAADHVEPEVKLRWMAAYNMMNRLLCAYFDHRWEKAQMHAEGQRGFDFEQCSRCQDARPQTSAGIRQVW